MGRWRLPSLLLTHMARTHENCNFNLFSRLEHLQSLKSPFFDRCFFFNLRHFSAIPHRLCTELDSGSVDFHPNYGLADEDEEIGKIPVKAYFLSTRLAWSYLGFVEEEIQFYSFALPILVFIVRPFFYYDLASQIHGFGSIDLKSMQAENLTHVVPPSSRSTKYIALRYSDFPSEISVRLFRNNVFIQLCLT